MRLNELRLENFRRFASLDVELGSGFNLFVGGNGAGKTSILEAAYVLSRGRSFRTGGRDSLGRLGGGAPSVFGAVERADGSVLRLGLRRDGARWDARVNGQTTRSLATLVSEIAVVCFEPGSHDLIGGASEGRRAYLDWGLFHVEPEFGPTWSRYHRALKQRNELLRSPGMNASLEPWEAELVASGSRIAEWRQHYWDALRPFIAARLAQFVPSLGDFTLTSTPGWDPGESLEVSLRRSRDRDRDRGFTTVGPHRADWSFQFALAPGREHLSRGQEKLCALAAVLAQAALFSEQRDEPPILCLDDLGSELDPIHQRAVVDSVVASQAQILVTATEVPASLVAAGVPMRQFHVEQGEVRTLV